MPKFLRLNSFKIYNILLFLVFSIITNTYNSIPLLYFSFYCIFHIIFIYLVIYYYTNILYFIFFIYGLFLDIYLINEIGPHLLIIIFTLLFVNLSSKYLYSLSSFKVYIYIIILIIIMFSLEIFLSYLLFNNAFNVGLLLKLILLSLIISFPIFLIFSKIDKY